MRRSPLIAVAILASLVLAPSASAVDDETVEFIAGFEGFYAKPYNDPAGHCTVGYGHLIHYGPCTKKDFKKWGPLSEEEALELLRKDLLKYEEAIIERIKKTPVTPPMMTALTSFAFNLGPGKLDRFRSPVRKKRRTTNIAGRLLKRNYIGAARDMRTYDSIIKGNKRIALPGLVRRRNEEFKLMKRGYRQLKKCGTKCTDAPGAEAPDTPDPGNGGGLPIR